MKISHYKVIKQTTHKDTQSTVNAEILVGD